MNARGAEAEIGLKIIANHFHKPFLNANNVSLPLNSVLSLYLEQHGVTFWNLCEEGISLLSAAVEELSLVPLLPTPWLPSPAAPSLTEQ